MNAFTGREYTCFYAKVLNKDMPRAIDLLSDIFLNSTFDPKELDKERLVILQEISMVDDTPDDLIHDLFSRRLWRKNQLGTSILGTEKTVKGLDRETILSFYKKHYNNGNVFITAAGGFKRATIKRLLNKAFGPSLTSGGESESSKADTMAGIKLYRKKLEQVHTCLGVPAFSQSSSRRYVMYILNSVLGGGMSSRLFQEIREKRGLAYSVYSYLSLYRDTGALVVYVGTGKDDFKKSIGIVLKEFSGLKKKLIGKAELTAAKEQLKGGMLIGLESSDARMMKHARDKIYFNRSISTSEIIKGLDKVSAGNVRTLANDILSNADITMVALGTSDPDVLPSVLKRKVDL